MRFLQSAALFMLALPLQSFAESPASSPSWHAQTLLGAIGYTALFSALGILLAVVGYRFFDRCTPGNLHEEIVQNKNVAAAIIGGAVILGVCIIIAAAMLG
ncbi:DUF350 domain-containing protein [Nibricoccus sp. IMCC34717]|uniref:DUF350 domain-containing protein n=1 Tax=Nibricoccus sp. IMCC34717 TaxID=3034021 RepID=UPI00384CB254